MSNSSQQAAEALADLQIEFSKWRSNKETPRERIPEALLHKAADLSNHLEDREVQKALGLSSTQWKRIQSMHQPDEALQQFVEVPNEGGIEVERFDVSISLPSGAVISISGLKNQSVSTMVERILEGAC